MSFFFFFNDTATTEIYTLSLHDALPIWFHPYGRTDPVSDTTFTLADLMALLSEKTGLPTSAHTTDPRSEEHTSELQSRQYLVCRLLLEKKKKHHYLTIAQLYNHHTPVSR